MLLEKTSLALGQMWLIYRAAVKKLGLSYYSKETLVFTIHPYYGSLIAAQSKVPLGKQVWVLVGLVRKCSLGFRV